MILDLVPNYDPVLHTPTPEFNLEEAPVNPVELYKNLAETMLAKGGIGLAAPQCGLPYRFFVIRTDPIVGMFNCRIVDKSEQTLELEEGCLSVPGLIIKIKRSRIIKARWEELIQKENGVSFETKTKVFSDLTARAIQHELDHLNGTMFYDKISKFQLEMLIKKNNKRNKIKYKLQDFKF